MVRISSTVFLAALVAGCVKKIIVEVPPCPAPTEAAVRQVSSLMVEASRNEDLLDWISEIDRYCNAIDSLN